MQSTDRPRPVLPALACAAVLAANGAAGQMPAPSDEQLPTAPPPTTANAPAGEGKPWYDGIGANGFLSASYSYGVNSPPSGANGYRVFDFANDKVKLDAAELVFQRPAAKPGDVGFRVDAVSGSSVPRVSSSFGLLQGEDADIQQAYLTLVAPIGSGLRLDAGKFVTHFGYEVIDGYDGFNDNATRSILFGYAIPFTHTGVKATYTFSDRITAMVEVVNGWDVARDNNGAKSVGAQLAFTPTKSISIFANFMRGAERADDEADKRTDLDLVAQWKVTETSSFAIDLNRGSEAGAAPGGGTAVWWAAAGYARLGLASGLALCARAEVFDDGGGARTGAAQTLKELTLTPEVKLGAHVVLRADLRVDFSNRDVFEKHDGSLGRSQATVLFNALYYF